MFKGVVLVLSLVSPGTYAAGFSEVAFPTEEACAATEEKAIAAAKANFPEERFGATEITFRCLPSAEADELYKSMQHKQGHEI